MIDREFVVAVLIALIVPVLIGSIYFVNNYKMTKNSRYVYESKSSRELLLLNNYKIENMELNNSVNQIDFEVAYTSGENEYETYHIELSNIHFEPRFNSVVVKWILSMYDEVKNQYFEFSTGTFDRKSHESVPISPSISIALGDSQSFRFRYYVLDGMDSDKLVQLNAELVLE